MSSARSFWVTGSTSGLGAAMVEQLVQAKFRVAASGRENLQFHAMAKRHGEQLLALTGVCTEQADRLRQEWGALDTLVINAGTCDYLPPGLNDSHLVEAIITTNMKAVDGYLKVAVPLLMEARAPQVVVILNLYTVSQLGDPSQPPTLANSLPERLRLQREALAAAGIDLTVVTPQAHRPTGSTSPVPEHWTAQTAAAEILAQLPLRKDEVALEALGLRNLWPLLSI